MKTHHIKKGEHKKSPAQGTAVGSGSRPTGGKVKIMSSAPAHSHKLGRAPAGFLK